MPFTQDNTVGFTDAQICMLNEALSIRMSRHKENEDHAADRINNNWFDGATLDDLIER